jgi:hypothetical protein
MGIPSLRVPEGREASQEGPGWFGSP